MKSNLTDQSIAKTLFDYCGGTKQLSTVCGATDFGMDLTNELSPYVKFRLKSNNPNIVKIIYNRALDTITLEFGLLRNLDYKLIKTIENVYCDQVADIFEMETGLKLLIKPKFE
ncbi:MAG: hypothetical protein KDD94_15070 [Calditrichaeota bacterium]|nr:hypothetical protein [Calditrichota bacterium]